MTRRLIAGFLTLCMLVSLCPPSAFAVHSSASEMTEPETVVTEPVAETGAPEETAAPDPVPSEPQKEAEPTQPAQTQPEGTLPEGEAYSYRSVSVGQTVTLTAGLAEGGSWTSDNLAAATVTAAEGDTLNALVYGVAAGVTTVTYAADGAEERWVVYVNDPAVQTGETTGETVAAEAPADSEQATMEDQPQGGSVLDKLGNLLTGAADTQAAAKSITAGKKTIYVGESITLTGSANTTTNTRWCNYTGTWESSDAAKAEVSGTGTSATLTGLAAGTVTVTHTYCSSRSNRNHTHSVQSETIEITVLARTLTALTVSGADTVAVGVPTQLTATAEPATAEMNLTWTSNDEETLTVTQTGIITGVKAGTATITVTDASTGVTASHTVTVREAVPVTDVTLTGADTMTAFTTTQLTAGITPADADVAGIAWESSNEEILTVDGTGLVTAVAPGEAVIKLTVTCTDGTRKTVEHTITVTNATESTAQALFYYLRSPDKDPASNASDSWGTSSLGIGEVNMNNATWDGNKNCFSVSGRVISWPSGFDGGVIPTTSSHWMVIFNAYKSSVEAKLGVTITADDVEYIKVHPYKVSRDNSSSPDLHVDCTVEVKTVGVYTATYFLWDAGTSGYEWEASAYYKNGATTQPDDFSAISNLPATKTVNGINYTFDGWYTNTTRSGSAVSFPYAVGSNVNFYAKYVAGYNVTYNLNGGQWNQSSTTFRKNEGTEVSIISEIPTKDGYQFIGWTSGDITEAEIEAGTFNMPAKNVTLTAQWEKSDFTLTVKYVFENGDKAADDYTANVTYGTDYSVTSPTVTGYTPDVAIVEGTMPAEDRTVTVTYRANTNAPYTVEHWLEELDGSYVKQDAQTETGTTGETVTASLKTFPGFTFNESVPGTQQSGAVAADGSLVLKLYYTRNTHKVTYTYTGTVPKDATALPAEATYKYGASVTVAPDATATGYTFSGWSESDFTMPDEDVTITGSFTANSHTLTILYQYTNGTTAAPSHTETLTYGTDYAVDSPVIPGYTASAQTVSGTMPDNNVDVTVVYSANTNTKYAVRHYQENLDGTGYTLVETDNLTGTTGEQTAAVAKDYTGFTAQPFQQETIDGNGTTVVDIYYNRNSYKVTYTYTGPFPADASQLPDEATYKYGASVTVAPDATATGYTFSGWDKTDFTMPAEDVTITGSFTAINYTLTIHYVYENGTKAAEDKTYNQNYGAGYEIPSPVIDGYTADQSTVSGTMPAHDVEVTVTYTVRSDLSYTVCYYWNGTTESVQDSKTISGVTFGTEVTLSPAAVANYTPVSEESQTLTVGTDSEMNVIIFYYYKNVELTANSDTKTYDGNEHTVTGFTTESVDTLPTFEGVTASGSGTNVDVYPVEFSEGAVGTVDTTEKYIVSKVTPGTLTIIANGTMTLIVEDYTGIYDGASHGTAATASVTAGTTVEYSTDGGDSWATTVPTITDVGTLTVTARATNPNYATAEKTYTLTVTKRPVTLTSETASKEYDGKPLTRPDVTVGGRGFVAGEVTNIRATGSVTYVSEDEVTNTIAFEPTDAFKDDNYDITITEGKLSITKKTEVIVITTPTNSKVYDGTYLVDYNHTYSGELAEGDTLIVTYSYDARQQDVGTAPNDIEGVRIVNAEGADVTGNYTFGTPIIGKLTVTPREIELTAASDSKVYDGSALTNSDYSITKGSFVDGEGLLFVTVEGSQTNVGSSANVITDYMLNAYTDSDNYDITCVNGTLTVTPSGDLTVEGTGYNNTYDGESHGYTAAANITDGTNISYSTDGGETWETTVPTIKDVGTVNVTVKAENPNYETATASYTLTVTPREIELTADSDSKDYDGTALTKNSYYISNGSFVDGEGLAAVTVVGSQTDVGSSENVITGHTLTPATLAQNYTITYQKGTLTVSASSALTVSGEDYTGTYDGASHGEAAVASVPGAKIEYSTDGGKSWTTTVPTIKDVGTVTVMVKATKDNYIPVFGNNYTLTVTPAEVTVTADNKTKVYGDSDPALTATVAGVLDGAEIRYDLSRVSGEDVGSYPITPTGAENQGNYHVTFLPGTLTVTKNGGLTVTATDYTGTYDGASHGRAAAASVTEGTTVEYSTDGGANWTTTVPTITDVGSVTVKVRATNPNYAPAENSYTLTVSKRDVVLTAGSKMKMYDGTPLTFDHWEITGGAFVGEEGLASVTVEGSQTVVGSSDNTITDYALKENTKAENYAITCVKGDLTVTASNALTVSGENYTGTYDGASHGEAATASVPEGTTVEYSTDGGKTWTTDFPTIKDAGTVNVTVKAENDNYETATASYTLTVSPREIVLTADSDSKDYDGTALTKNSYTVTKGSFVDGEGLAAVAVVGSQTVVGSSDNTITGHTLTEATLAQNYTITYQKGTLTVNPSNVLTVSGEDYTGTYDANSHGEAATASVKEGTTVSYSVDGGNTWMDTYPTIKNVGTVNVTVKAENPNYQTATASYTLTVTPAEVTVTADDKTKVYGDPDPALTAKVAGVLDGTEIRYDLSRGSGEDVGSYPITPTGEANQGNYRVTFVPGTLTVTKNGGLTVTGTDYTGIYDGASHGTAATASVTAGTTVSYSTDGGENWTTTVPTIQDAGTVNVTVKAENDNYETATASYTLIVNRRPVTLTSETASKEYDGTPLTRPDVTVTGSGFVAGEVTNIRATGSATYVDDGEVANTIAYETAAAFKAGNYDVTTVEGTLSITKRTEAIVITTPSNNKVYDGTALVDYNHTYTGKLLDDDMLIVTYLNSSAQTDVGSTPNAYGSVRIERNVDGVKKDVTTSYTFGEPNIGTLTVTPREIELTAGSATKAYDGTPLTENSYTVSKGTFVTGEGLDSVTVEGSRTVVGSSDNVITGHTLKENTKAENYTITYVKGSLDVTPATGEVVVTVTGNRDTHVYDGNAHTVTGFTVQTNNPLYTESSFKFTGAASASRTDAGKTMMGLTAAQFENTDGNFAKVTFVVNDGYMEITPVTDEVVVTVTGNRDTQVYDGTKHTVTGYAVSGISNPLYPQSGISFTGDASASRAVVGKTMMGLTAAQFGNTNGNFEKVTFVVDDGYMEITPVTDEVLVTVTGVHDTKLYDGAEHSVEGYTSVIGNPLYTSADFALVEGGTASAVRKDAGKTMMGLTAESFENRSPNFENVRFVVEADGYMEITRRQVTLTSETASKVYDGTPLTRPTVTVTGDGFVEGEATDIRATGSILNAVDSPVTNTVTFTPGADFNADNYIVTKSEGTLTITPVTDKVVVTVTGHTDTVPYDGAAHTVTGFDAVANNALYTADCYAFSGTGAASGTDADTYAMGLAADQFRNVSGNFTEVVFEVADGSLTVTRRPVTLTSPTDSKVYDRTPLTRSDVTVGGMGFVSGEVTGIRATGSVLNVSEGTVPNPIEFTPAASYKASNYDITYRVGTLSITPAARATVVVTGNTATFVYDGQPHTVTGFTNDGRSRDITVTLVNTGADSATGTEIDRYYMGLTAADFIASSPNYRKVDVEVVDGYLDIVTVNVNVTVTVRGNRDTVTYDGSEHTVTGYEIVSVTTNVGRTVGMDGITLRLRGAASASGTEPGTYPMGLTAADFDVDTTIYRGVRVVVEDGQLVIEPETVPETDPTEEIPDESTPLSEPEEIPEEEVPLATPVWALLNLILSLLTVLGSLFLLSGLFGKKEEEATDENGNLILDDNGDSVMNRIKKRAGWRITSLIPAIGSVIAFFLTENMRNPMVLVDRWTLLMVIIAVIQVMVMMLSKKKTEETQEA